VWRAEHVLPETDISQAGLAQSLSLPPFGSPSKQKTQPQSGLIAASRFIMCRNECGNFHKIPLASPHVGEHAIRRTDQAVSRRRTMKSRQSYAKNYEATFNQTGGGVTFSSGRYMSFSRKWHYGT